MIYPEGKPDSLMTTEKLEKLELINQEKVELAKKKLGIKFLLHPANMVKKIKKSRSKNVYRM